jgi:hypothetical protein
MQLLMNAYTDTEITERDIANMLMDCLKEFNKGKDVSDYLIDQVKDRIRVKMDEVKDNPDELNRLLVAFNALSEL